MRIVKLYGGSNRVFCIIFSGSHFHKLLGRQMGDEGAGRVHVCEAVGFVHHYCRWNLSTVQRFVSFVWIIVRGLRVLDDAV